MPTGVELIASERERQVSEEDWSSEHDDAHQEGELAMAAAAYALLDVLHDRRKSIARDVWPYAWWGEDIKPRDHIRNLVRAGALIAAEIDRVQRKNA